MGTLKNPPQSHYKMYTPEESLQIETRMLREMAERYGRMIEEDRNRRLCRSTENQSGKQADSRATARIQKYRNGGHYHDGESHEGL